MSQLKRVGSGHVVIVLLLLLAIGLLARTAAKQHKIGTITRDTDGMTMVYVPEGSFQMGAVWWDLGWEHPGKDEKPRHEVTLDAFWLDQTEVTMAQWNICFSAGACGPTMAAGDDDLPSPSANWDDAMRTANWYDADTYCKWAGGQLPTEAQWEYAARGPDNLRFPWGNWGLSCDLAQYGGCRGPGLPARNFSGGAMPVGSFAEGASWVGALDMTGNVWEWVADWYDSDYYAISPKSNPAGPDSGDLKVMRGGSWATDGPSTVRSSYRTGVDPNHHTQNRNYTTKSFWDYGFRCVVLPGHD